MRSLTHIWRSDVKKKAVRLFPELFECGLYDQDFTARSFYLWLLRGIIDSIIIFFTTYLVFYTDVIAGSGLNAGMWSFGA